MAKKLKLAAVGALLLVVGYFTGSPAAVTAGTSAVIQATQE